MTLLFLTTFWRFPADLRATMGLVWRGVRPGVSIEFDDRVGTFADDRAQARGLPRRSPASVDALRVIKSASGLTCRSSRKWPDSLPSELYAPPVFARRAHRGPGSRSGSTSHPASGRGRQSEAAAYYAPRHRRRQASAK